MSSFEACKTILALPDVRSDVYKCCAEMSASLYLLDEKARESASEGDQERQGLAQDQRSEHLGDLAIQKVVEGSRSLPAIVCGRIMRPVCPVNSFTSPAWLLEHVLDIC